jgi:deoxyribodipyrimidine photolyase-related protein
MSTFVDAIGWVSLPNTLGMSQFGEGGVMGTKTVLRYLPLHQSHERLLRQLSLSPGDCHRADACRSPRLL